MECNCRQRYSIYIKQPIKDESGAIVDTKIYKVAIGNVTPTATKEPENTEPKVDDTKKEEPKKDPNVKPQPYGKIYKSVADFPKDTIIIRDRKSFIAKFRGKTLTLVGECKDPFHVRLFQDEQGNNYRVDNLEYMIKFFKFTSPKVLTHTEDRDGNFMMLLLIHLMTA